MGEQQGAAALRLREHGRHHALHRRPRSQAPLARGVHLPPARDDGRVAIKAEVPSRPASRHPCRSITAGLRDCQITAIQNLEAVLQGRTARAPSSRWQRAPARPSPPSLPSIACSSTPTQSASCSSWTPRTSASRPSRSSCPTCPTTITGSSPSFTTSSASNLPSSPAAARSASAPSSACTRS